eukprot:9370955-Lingulodinium_polyedra.AAC.1
MRDLATVTRGLCSETTRVGSVTAGIWTLLTSTFGPSKATWPADRMGLRSPKPCPALSLGAPGQIMGQYSRGC